MLDRPMQTRVFSQLSNASSYPVACFVLLVAPLIILSTNTAHAEDTGSEKSLASQIDLIYTSDMRLREIQGGTWETIYFEARESPRYPVRTSPPAQWRKHRNNPKIRFKRDRRDYKNWIMAELDNNPDEVSSRILALRSLEDSGLEIERRPLKELREADTTSILKQPKDTYRKISIERSKKSSALEDIVAFETRYLTESEMEREYGIEWGQPISDVSTSALVRSFHLKSPKAIIRDSDWQLPQWERYWWAAQTSPIKSDEFLEIPLAGSEGVRHYFYVQSTLPAEALRIVATHPIHGLLRFHDYQDGIYRLTSRVGDHIRYLNLDALPESTSPKEPRKDTYNRSRLGAASASLRLAQIELHDYTLFNAKDFLDGPGQMFSQWNELHGSRYDFYARNVSDEDALGVRYETKPVFPPFCLVEYAENAVKRVVVYNELLIETDYRMPTWWMQHGGRVKWSLFGVLGIAGAIFLTMNLTTRRQRTQQEQRRAGEIETSKKFKKSLEYAGKRIGYFIENENYDDAESVIEHLRCNSSEEASEVIRLQLEKLREARLLSAKRRIDHDYKKILAVVEDQGLSALQQLETHLADQIRDVDEEVASKTKELRDLSLSTLQAKQLQDDESKEVEIQEDIRIQLELRQHFKRRLEDARQLANNRDKFEMFVNFLAGSLAVHEQKAIEILAAARNIEMDRLRNNLPLFISLINQDHERRLIASNVIGERMELEARAQQLEQELSRLRASKAMQERERERLEKDLRAGLRNKKELQRVTAALQKTEDELEARIAEIDELRRRIKNYEDEERKEAELRERERARLLQAIRGSVYAEDARRDEFKSRRLCFDSEFGFIIAEAHRVLQIQIKNGRWVDATDTPEFVMRVVESFVREEDYEDRFLHLDGKRVIRAINRYLSGKTPLSDARNSALCLTHHQWALERVHEGNSRYLLEAWLEPHRRQQTEEYEVYKRAQHDRQAELEGNLLTIGLTEPTLKEWVDSWDEQPWLFVTN